MKNSENTKWSRDYSACQRCGTTEIPHRNYGLCRKCFKYKVYRNLPQVCPGCGNTFTPLNKQDKTSYRKFCTPKCRNAYRVENNLMPSKPAKYKTKAQFLVAVEKIILGKGRYVTMDELCAELKVCGNSTFKKWNVSILGTHNKLGIKKPVSVVTEIVIGGIQDLLPDMIREATFEDLISSKGMVLRFDLYSEKYRLLIEVDGSQHKEGHDWYSEHRASNDRAKEDFAKKNYLNLLRIPFTKSHKIDIEEVRKVVSRIVELGVQDRKACEAKPFIGECRQFTGWGNQQPEVVGILPNGPTTHRPSRTDGTRTESSVTWRDRA